MENETVKNQNITKCRICGQEYPTDSHTHCPNCLSGTDPDEDCGGTLEPISIWVKPDDSWDIIFRCRLCGAIKTEPMHRDDSPIKVMSIAAKPLAMPPFPIERMKEMTDMTGGNGNTDGYYYEEKK